LVRAKWLEKVEKRLEAEDWRLVNSHSGTPEPDDLIETDWDTALNLVADKFSKVKEAHGSEAFAVLASAKCTNEENYLFNKFTRQILATNSLDHCARL